MTTPHMPDRNMTFGASPYPFGSGDARDWAHYWMTVLVEHPNIAYDEGTMIGWFANAMCAALDAQSPDEAKAERELPPDQDFYVLSRDALLMFLGEMALPPWTDVDGTKLGGAIDCALIASRITDWLKANDLSDVYLGLNHKPEESA